MHFAHGRLSMLLFYSGNAYGPRGVINSSGINGVNRNLLYPAIRAVAETPLGYVSLRAHNTTAYVPALSQA